MGIRRKPEGVQVISPAIHLDLTASHYTRVAGPGEAVNRASCAPRVRPDAATHQPNHPKETTMFRIFTTAAVLALTIATAEAGPAVTVHYGDLDLSSAAGADVLNSRIQEAAQTSCAGLRGPARSLFYPAWYASCVRDVSANTSTRIAARSGKPRVIASK
jgi:UrcA family protein